MSGGAIAPVWERTVRQRKPEARSNVTRSLRLLRLLRLLRSHVGRPPAVGLGRFAGADLGVGAVDQVELKTKSASTQSVGDVATARYSPGIPLTAHTSRGGPWDRQEAAGSSVVKPVSWPTGDAP